MSRKQISFIMRYLLFLLGASVFSLAYAQFGKGDVVFKGKTQPDVLFSHKFHTVSMEIKCEICHAGFLSSYIEKAKAKGIPLKDAIEKSFCENCHNGQIGFSTTDDKKCVRCHSQKSDDKNKD